MLTKSQLLRKSFAIAEFSVSNWDFVSIWDLAELQRAIIIIWDFAELQRTLISIWDFKKGGGS